jgi:hypothetical protein
MSPHKLTVWLQLNIEVMEPLRQSGVGNECYMETRFQVLMKRDHHYPCMSCVIFITITFVVYRPWSTQSDQLGGIHSLLPCVSPRDPTRVWQRMPLPKSHLSDPALPLPVSLPHYVFAGATNQKDGYILLLMGYPDTRVGSQVNLFALESCLPWGNC